MNLREKVAKAPRCQHNQYPLWVRVMCRMLYRDGLTIPEIAEKTGVSESTLLSWREKAARGEGSLWDYPAQPLQQPKRSRLVMPADAAGCLIVAAELLWLARGRRP